MMFVTDRLPLNARILALIVAGLILQSTALAVDYANINISLNPSNPLDPPTVTIPSGHSTVPNAALGTEGFFLDSGTVLGEYPVRIGTSASDDAAGGVLLAYVRENGRDVGDPAGLLYATSSTVSDDDPTSVNTRAGSGGLSLAVHRAGQADPGSVFPVHAPFAADLAAAYFPFDQGWLAGTASSSVNGGPINQFVGSAGLSLGTNFVVDGVGTNKHRLLLPGVTDSRRQGFLFVNHAKNEANYAMSEPADDGNGFVIVTHDNATDGASVTVDPISFVYIPLGTPNFTMARIHPSSGQNLQPTAMQQSGLPFTITAEGGDGMANPGRYRLSIPGHAPNTGVLLVSPSTQGRDAGGAQTDNVVTYQADGNEWVILSQDLPNLNGIGQFSRERISYFNFAFLPFDAPPTAPGPIQPPAWNRTRIVGWNAETIEESPGNGTGENYVNVLEHTSDVSVMALSENLGDIGFAVDGDFLIAEDGVMFSTLTQGLRDNSSTGGFTDYGVVNTGLFVPEWITFAGTADPLINSEFNINFATVFFGADSGFDPVGGIDTIGGTLEVVIPGANSLTDGVLMSNGWGNNDLYSLVSPKVDGSGWDLELHDNNTNLENPAPQAKLSYVYLPYDSENLIAGWVDEDGTLLSSTDESEFTLTKEGDGTYRLSIPGKSPQTGMLMLNGTGLAGSIDNTVVYEASGNDFLILGLDMITSDEANAGALVDLEDSEFSFAYIDFDAPPIAPGTVELLGDYNQNGVVDAADYTVWRDNFGSSAALPNDDTAGVGQDDYERWKSNFGSTSGGGGTLGDAAVPEPASGILVLAGLIATVCCRSLTRNWLDAR